MRLGDESEELLCEPGRNTEDRELATAPATQQHLLPKALCSVPGR